MSLAAISHAIALAAPAALCFAVLLVGTHWLAPRLPRRRIFLASISNTPAERLWREQHRLGRRRAQVLLPILVFIIAAAVLTIAESAIPGLQLGYAWQIIAVASGAAATAAGIAYALQLTLARRRQRLRIDANLAIAQALVKLSGNRNRMFHDVPTAYGALDHVVAGLHGIYAINVVARRRGKEGSNDLRLENERIDFGQGTQPETIHELNKRVWQFSRECSKRLKQEIQVRHVIAVPGREISVQSNDRLLIANENNIAMLTGWKDERDYLMDEDIDALHQHLDERCSRPI